MLIEVRIGPGRRKLAGSISNISRLCGIPSDKIHRIPHITLYGSFAADYRQVERVKEIMVSVGKKYTYLPYLIDGFRWIKGSQGRVIYFNIIPSEKFQKFRHELAQRLLKIVPRTRSFDKEEDFLFHSTLAYKLDSREFESIWSYVSGEKALAQKFSTHSAYGDDYRMRYFYLPLDALRVTLLNDQSRIICEYDFMQQKLLTRGESENTAEWEKTLRLFRTATGIEGKPGIEKQVPPYVISDLHLGESNIIHHCARPFNPANIAEMDNVLIENWNNTVDDGEIYYLGKITACNAVKLGGKIHLISESSNLHSSGYKNYQILRYGRYSFLITHDPERLPVKWDNWVIHGHKHNNDMKNYPFINGVKKTINVCPELTGYRPVSLDFLASLKLSSIKRVDTIGSVPVIQ